MRDRPANQMNRPLDEKGQEAFAELKAFCGRLPFFLLRTRRFALVRSESHIDVRRSSPNTRSSSRFFAPVYLSRSCCCTAAGSESKYALERGSLFKSSMVELNSIKDHLTHIMREARVYYSDLHCFDAAHTGFMRV